MEGCVLFLLLCACFGAHRTSAGSHAHRFLTTVTSELDEGLPLYIQTRELDDVTLISYEGGSQLLERRAAWFQSANITLGVFNLRLMSYQNNMQHFMRNIMDAVNESDEYHVLQRRQQCILYDNGTVEAILRDAYDRQPFLSFNVDTANWTAEVPEAEFLLETINANRTINEKDKKTLTDTCASHIQELLILGNEAFSRTQVPIIRLHHNSTSNDLVLLSCQAYNHYPKDISLMWDKNGLRVPENGQRRITLPLPDNNYLTSVTVIVTPTHQDIYTCTVDHSSLKTPQKHHWRLRDLHFEAGIGDRIGMVIALCIAVTLLVCLLVFSIIIWQKSRGYNEMS